MLAHLHSNPVTPLLFFVIPAFFALGIMLVQSAKVLKRLESKVTDIDNAVNNQPTGTKPMVDKVSQIQTEQVRVAATLAAKESSINKES